MVPLAVVTSTLAGPAVPAGAIPVIVVEFTSVVPVIFPPIVTVGFP